MNIIEKNIEDLKPYKNNPRKNEDAIEYVKNSIKEFGFKVPIIIDKNNEIVAGHTRYEAAKRLDFKTIPVIIADDLTPKQIKAFRLADNKVSEFSKWDFHLLDLEIADIEDINMEDFGFEEHFDEEMDFSDLFTPAEHKEKKAKTVKCPHCGEEIEI